MATSVISVSMGVISVWFRSTLLVKVWIPFCLQNRVNSLWSFWSILTLWHYAVAADFSAGIFSGDVWVQEIWTWMCENVFWYHASRPPTFKLMKVFFILFFTLPHPLRCRSEEVKVKSKFLKTERKTSRWERDVASLIKQARRGALFSVRAVNYRFS